MDLLRHMRRVISGDFLSPAGYFFLGWIGFYILVGVALSIHQQKKENRQALSLVRALKYCFPKETFWGPSAKLDYKIILLSHYLLIYPVGLILIVGQSKVTPS